MSVANIGVDATWVDALCNTIQMRLIERAGRHAPELIKTPNGYLDAIVSPQNTTLAGVVKEPVNQGGNGKKMSVDVIYATRTPAGCSVTTRDTDCVADVQRSPKETNVDITNYIGSQKQQFQEDEIRKFCEMGQGEWVENTIMSLLDGITTDLNVEMLADQLANFGAYRGGAVDNVANWLDTAANHRAPIYHGEAQLLREYRRAGGQGLPLLVGEGNLHLYVQQRNLGCCNQFGIELSASRQFDYFMDVNIDDLGNADDFVMLAPGAVQLVSWNENIGTHAKIGSTFFHRTLIDPFTGITWDWQGEYDTCLKKWVMWIYLNWELTFIPSDAFDATDPLSTTNYSFKGQADAA